MKYSIRGRIRSADGTPIIADVNQFALWRLVTENAIDESDYPVFNFEAWVNTESDKLSLFNLIKVHVDENTGYVDWHECTHDEPYPHSCIVAETYQRG